MRRLAHISDLHFGKTDPLLVEALERELATDELDLVVVTGDLTQRAKERQFQQARAFLDRLRVPYLVIPGNHDIAPLYAPLTRLTAPFRSYRQWISAELDTVYADDEFLVIGINTADPLRWKEGQLSQHQIDWMTEQSRAYPNRFRIVASHHPLLGAEARPLEHRVRRSDTLLRAVEQCGFGLALSGHLHESLCSVGAWRHGTAQSVLLVRASTATSTRLRGHLNAYNRITLDGSRVEIRVHAWDGHAFPAAGTHVHVRVGDSWRLLSSPQSCPTGLAPKEAAPRDSEDCGSRLSWSGPESAPT